MNQGEAAETIVRIMLNGTETFVKISGTGIKGAIALLYAYSKENKQLRGKTSLKNMLRSGRELKVFTIKELDFKKFAEQAKKYGVLYSALLDKKGTNLDGYVDIMVRAEDAPRINRIVERFNLVSFEDAKIKMEINKEKNAEVKDINDSIFIDELLGRNTNKNGREKSNPKLVWMEKNNPFVPLLKNKKNLEGSSKKNSIRKELKEIREDIGHGINYGDGKNVLTKFNKSKGKKNKIK